MLLKISASRCRFTPFAGYFRATTSTEAVTLYFVIFTN